MRKQLGTFLPSLSSNDMVSVFRMVLVLGVVFVFFYVAVQVGKKTQGFENSQCENKSMFLFADNKSDPSCCNFSYSSSNGCVCINKEQQMLLHTRGGNRTIDADF